jgi:kynureninase
LARIDPRGAPDLPGTRGQVFLRAIGVERLREYSVTLQRRLVALLAERRIAAQGGTDDRGAFVVVRASGARTWVGALDARGVDTDARGEWLRLCPDVLTTDAELTRAATTLAEIASR